MPPKQVTLGYVRDSQTTLSKDANQVRPRQTKLALSSKTLSKKNETANVERHTLDFCAKARINDGDPNNDKYMKTENRKRMRSPLPELEESSELIEQSETDGSEALSIKRRRLIKLETDNDNMASNLGPEDKTKIEGEIASNNPISLHLFASNKSKELSTVVKKEDVSYQYGIKASPSLNMVTENGCPSPDSSISDVDELPGEPKNEEGQTGITGKFDEMAEMTLMSKAKVSHSDWKAGEPVPYAALCETFSVIEMTSKRLVIASHCSIFLSKVLRLTPEDLLSTLLLMVNKLAADYAGIELGIGESLIMKAIGESTGRTLAMIKEHHKEIGDLGLVSVMSRSRQPTMFPPKPLTVRGVHKALIEVATVSGHGTQSRKIDLIKKLLSSADAKTPDIKIDVFKDKGGASEAKFIVRFLEGKLRLGLAEKTVLISLAHAIVCHEAERMGSGRTPSSEELVKGESILKAVYSEIPSYEIIVPKLLEHGIFRLRENCKLQPGVPLKPMLARPTKAITEVLNRFESQKFTCEYKYDGERAQIHYVAPDSPVQYLGPSSAASKTATGGLAAIFSRNSEDLSKKYPDILAKLNAWVNLNTTSFVLDCESVAWDRVEKKVLPFQQLMTRKRKDVKAEDVKVKVCVFAFDLLFLNGEAVVQKSLRERRELLHSAFTPVEDEFAFAIGMDGQELDEIQDFLDESMKASCEGLMVKMLDGPESSYEPSKRSRNWLKVKKDYLSGIGDSLDLVVLGAYHGKGKRTSVYGAFLLACHNPTTDSYETICNIGTGFSEAILEELHIQLSAVIIDRPKPFYSHASSGTHQPDVWFEPKYIWEVKAADLTVSPRYKAGSKEGVDGEKGISLRFPRFIKVRDDKKPEMATTSRQVVEMYRKQESVAKSQKPAVDDDFEY